MLSGLRLCLIMICFLLASCAGPRMAQDLQAGKASFQSGEYKEAFRQLLPIAVQGKAEAQYAVGYMYYYGYGVPEDSVSGLFWMRKAADQNYLPAIRALELLQRPTPESQSIVPSRQPSREENYRKTVLRAEDLADPMIRRETAPLSSPPVEIQHPAPASQTFSRHYALQLYGSYHLNSVKELQSALRLNNTGHVYQTTYQGKNWYVLTFGNFATAHEAAATRNNLPPTLRGMHPWVRNVSDLRLM